MKWIQFEYEGNTHYGVIDGEMVQVTDLAWEDVLSKRPFTPLAALPLADIQPLNPIGRPHKIICIGLNYLDHCRETGAVPPERPLIFTKFTTAMNDPDGEVRWSAALTQKVDYEAELAVIIGKNGRYIPESDALSYIAGYTAANDITARDLQRSDGQFIRGKSLDSFCPMGPAFVTADDIPDPQNLEIESRLNGRVMQESNTSQMIFPVAKLISFCSQAFTLEAGDVLLTGTPHGVGIGRTPQLFMQNGDEIVVEVEGIGSLRNWCRVDDGKEQPLIS